MGKLLIKNGTVINENRVFNAHIIIDNNTIYDIIKDAGVTISEDNFDSVINAQNKWVMPGVIDDQVHFREPGLTHKADIESESKAAIAGGITSFMEMPNTNPQTISNKALEEKFSIASDTSWANYSFYLGATNENIEELKQIDKNNVCGIKVFMGASTGNMLVDDTKTLEKIFAIKNIPIATHCEDEQTIQNNIAKYKEKYGKNLPIEKHWEIRSHEACYKSSSLAVNLARKHGARLHVLHISTADELELFNDSNPRNNKQITSEACIHHLWFTADDYEKKGALIKWNPAVKLKSDRDAIREAVKKGIIDVIATDHAPHTLEEKQNTYFKAPSGGPLVQHALITMLEMCKQGVFTPELVVDKMCHAPADLFNIKNRGYIRKGYFADLVIIDPNSSYTVNKSNILYKCNWSPFEEQTFNSKIEYTIVNGSMVYSEGKFTGLKNSLALKFNR